MTVLRVFVGYDSREPVAYHVLSHSILEQSSIPVSVTPLVRSKLPIMPRRDGSTEFSYTRFLVPWLCDYRGMALFMDCDMLVRCDIAEVFSEAMPYQAVHVVKHPDYTPRDSVKFLGESQKPYAKKNWSSLMLFNCGACRSLTPAHVGGTQGMALHQFKWLQNEDMIGELPATYNHLEGEQRHDPYAKVVHFTRGGPWFKEYEDCQFADEWRWWYSKMTEADGVPARRQA